MMNNFENASSNEVSRVEEEKQKLLNDLKTVGPTKPLGYLPISTLVETCGVTPEQMRTELEKKGLTVLRFSDDESDVGSGALFAYDERALDKVLLEGAHILERNGWPTKSAEFVRHLKVLAEDPELYKLVMQAFSDPRLRKK